MVLVSIFSRITFDFVTSALSCFFQTKSMVSLLALMNALMESDFEFWKSKLTAAYRLRENLGLTNSPLTNVYRLVHAEGDGLPGLIIDIYNTSAVIQTHTLGMQRQVKTIADALTDIYSE